MMKLKINYLNRLNHIYIAPEFHMIGTKIIKKLTLNSISNINHHNINQFNNQIISQSKRNRNQ